MMPKLSLLFRLNRFIYFLVKGVGRLEKEHFIFTLKEPLDDFTLYRMLAGHNFQPNVFGFVYRGQIYQCRQLVDGGMHQYHLRFYDDGRCTGHWELSPEWDTGQHLQGKDLRDLTEPEIYSLRLIFKLIK